MDNTVYILMGQDDLIYGVFDDITIANYYGENLSLTSPYHYEFDLLECEMALNRPDLGWNQIMRIRHYADGYAYPVPRQPQ